MNVSSILAATARFSVQRARAVAAIAILLSLVAGGLAAARLGITTDVGGLFSASLPWKQREAAEKRDFPQFDDLIVAVIDARIPEEADSTAAALAEKLAADPVHFRGVRRPDASPYLRREGLLFLDPASLTALLDGIVDAAPFLGQLAADPSAAGLFGALGLVGTGVAHHQAHLENFAPALRGFHETLRSVLDGTPKPLSWQSLLAGKLAGLAGQNRIVLIRPRLDYRAVQPGGAATAVIRTAAASLHFVANGEAHVSLTGSVPLSDEEFSSAAQGARTGLAVSFSLVVLWLILALGSWRLIVPVVLTLLLGLLLTTGFAAAAVGTLNLISVAFAILFVGIAVDFAIQFAVRFRGLPHGTDGVAGALIETGRRVGPQVLVASAATAAGFLAFVPTRFQGVAELGLIAGGGMLIAFLCTLIFLPAMLKLCRPRAESEDIGFAWAAPFDAGFFRVRWPLLALFAVLFGGGAWLTPRLAFDSNTLHTKPQTSEALRTLMRLLDSPVTNPFTADILRPSIGAAEALRPALERVDLVDHIVSLKTFVPDAQPEKLAAIADAAGLLAPILNPPVNPPPVTAQSIRSAIGACLASLGPALSSLEPEHPLTLIAADLRALRDAPDATLLAANGALVGFLPAQLQQLRQGFAAMPVTERDIPDDIRRDYVLPDGRARLQIVPKTSVADSELLHRFVVKIQAIAPDAEGPAVTIVSTADTIIGAFRQAALAAIVAIAAILLLALRRPLDAALVLAPLLLSAAMTVLVMRLAGMTLNYANVIALPLLLGVGVSFNIYFVMNWRAGARPRLTSATTKAVAFSALTTGTAFGSLALSAHPGTASMGTVLLISLGCTLVATLIFVPALLAAPPGRAEPAGN